MNGARDLEATLALAVAELEKSSVPYMLIGGLALSVWALPRATVDIDFTLWVRAEELEAFCHSLVSRLSARVSDPIAFVHRTHVLPVTAPTGVNVDFVFAAFPFEKAMLDRAVLRLFGNTPVRVATIEDLLLLKLPSLRAKDREDAQVILNSYGKSLDWSYLLPAARLLAETLEQPELTDLLYKHHSATEP